MLWVCASFWGPADLCADEASLAEPAAVAAPSTLTLGTAPGLHAPDLAPCLPVQTYLQMLSVICVVTRCPPHSSFDAKAVSLFFDLISQDLAVSEPADEARHYFLHSYPVTQLYSLQALFKFCASHRDAIQTIRSGGLLSKAFSSGFYLPVKDSSQPQPQLE